MSIFLWEIWMLGVYVCIYVCMCVCMCMCRVGVCMDQVQFISNLFFSRRWDLFRSLFFFPCTRSDCNFSYTDWNFSLAIFIKLIFSLVFLGSVVGLACSDCIYTLLCFVFLNAHFSDANREFPNRNARPEAFIRRRASARGKWTGQSPQSYECRWGNQWCWYWWWYW